MPRVMPTIVPRAYGSHHGLPRPVKAGTRKQPSVSGTVAASVGDLAGVLDDAEAVAQPLDGGAGDEDGALQRVGVVPSASVQPTVVSSPSTGSGQVVAHVHQHEAPRAVGVLRHAGLEAGLAEQRRLLVARDARDRDARRARPTPSAVTPKRPLDGRTSGRAAAGTPKRSSSSSDHASERMSNSIVRLALEGSVANTPPSGPPVRFHSTQASTVPSARSGSTSHARPR